MSTPEQQPAVIPPAPVVPPVVTPPPIAPAAPVKPPKPALWKRLLTVAWQVLISPQARRYEIALAVMIYEAIRAALGHA